VCMCVCVFVPISLSLPSYNRITVCFDPTYQGKLRDAMKAAYNQQSSSISGLEMYQ
jgi:hypothetical protein